MGTSEQFRSAYHAWLALIRDRLAAMESGEAESEALTQSRQFLRELWCLRRECEVLQSYLRAQCMNGQLAREQTVRTLAFLHDLGWLLDISPSAPPVLARQCLRIAQDRIVEEARAESCELGEDAAWDLEQARSVA